MAAEYQVLIVIETSLVEGSGSLNSRAEVSG